MRVNSKYTIPYIIHENVLHVFDIMETLYAIERDEVPFSCAGSLITMKVYLFSEVVWYDNVKGTLVTKSMTLNKTSIIALMLLWYKFNPLGKRRPIIFIKGKSSWWSNSEYRQLFDMGNLADQHIPRPKLVSMNNKYSWYAAYYCERKFYKYWQTEVELSCRNDGFSDRLILVSRRTEYARTIFVSDRKLPLISNVTTLGNDVITVEDHVKWYDLFRISCFDETVNAVNNFNDIEWFDHTPVPSSVVSYCKKNNLKIDLLAYIAICCRWVEDMTDGDFDDEDIFGNNPDILASKGDLYNAAFVSPFSVCTTYGLPWSLSRFGGDIYIPGMDELLNKYARVLHFDKRKE